MAEHETSPRLAVAGGGAFGLKHIDTLHRLGLLAAVCEPREERQAFLAERFPEVRLHHTLAHLLEHEDEVAGVIVATPPHTHHTVAMEAMLGGRDVLVEKPMTVDTAEARDLVQTAERLERVLMVGHLMLYHPAVLALRDLIVAGSLGDIHYLYARRVKLGTVRAHENVLWSFAPHDIAVQLFLTDQLPVRVSCTGHGYVQEKVEDVAFLTMDYGDGRQSSIHVGWLEPDNVRRLVVVGNRASAVLDELSPTPLTLHRQHVDPTTLSNCREGVENPTLPQVEPLTAECQHFLECIQTRSAPRSSGAHGLAVVHLLQQATQSLHSGGDWKNIDHELLRPPVRTTR